MLTLTVSEEYLFLFEFITKIKYLFNKLSGFSDDKSFRDDYRTELERRFYFTTFNSYVLYGNYLRGQFE